jgi:proteic killer suppression protein
MKTVVEYASPANFFAPTGDKACRTMLRHARNSRRSFSRCAISYTFLRFRFLIKKVINSMTSVLLCSSMILFFADKATEDVYDGKNSADARRLLPRNLWNIAVRKLDQIDASVSLDDLRVPPGNRLEALEADRIGQYSIRINDQYRICFVWNECDASQVEIVDYH